MWSKDFKLPKIWQRLRRCSFTNRKLLALYAMVTSATSYIVGVGDG